MSSRAAPLAGSGDRTLRRLREHSAELTFWAFAAVLLALTWSAVLLKAAGEREQQLQATVRANANLARAFEEHTVRTLASADQTVRYLKYQYERLGDAIDIARYVREGMIVDTLFNQLGVIDANGIYAHSNLADHRRIDLSDREHFRVHRAADSGRLFVSQPVLGRASGKWSMQLTRRISTAEGGFGGVVVISIDPFYFTRLYSEVDLGRRGVVTLVGEDGVVRARRSGEEVSTGQSLAESRLFRDFAGAPQGTYSASSAVDGIDRIYAFRRLQDYPLMVIVGVSRDEALAEVEERVRTYAAFAAVASLLIVALAVWATVQLRRQRAISRRLKASQARAEEANRLKSEFLASMSHELRTPLNGIIGYAEYLRDTVDDATEREFAGVILRSGQHLLELVNSILDLSRIEAGRLDLHPAEVPLRELVDEAIAAHRPAADAKGLSLEAAIGDGVPATWRCDRLRVLQVLNNLLHNAVKFTDRGGVSLRVSVAPRGLALEVADTGAGVPEAMRDVIFEKFRQADAFVTRRHGGTGLGLALSRELATLMGGTLALRPSRGEGSRFVLELPVTPPHVRTDP